MMKQHVSRWAYCGLTAAALLTLTGCAGDGYDDDERFVSVVKNTQLSSPEINDINIVASADGKTQTISWPVVPGAGGYLFSFYDASNLEEPIVKDSLIDGCSVTVKREEDVNYRIDLRTMGNKQNNNTEAQETTTKLFSTFTPTFAVIPAGSNLNEWFAQNPVPEDSVGVNLNYDLEGGADYTLSDELDFELNAVTLRSTSKTNHAHVTLTTSSATIAFAAGFNLKYIDFDCAAQVNNKGIFVFSGTDKGTAANAIDPDAFKWTGIYVAEPVTFVNCNFDNVRGYFFWDNSKKVCFETVLVDNVLCHLAPEANVAGGVFWTNKGGQINNLTVSNSTFYLLPDCKFDYNYFYQAGGVSAQDVHNNTTATNSVNYLNSTFYHLTWNNHQWGNYNRMQGRTYSYWVMTNCIFYDCSTSGSVPRRFLHGQAYANSPQNKTFLNNTYMKNDGTFQDPQNYDTSGTIIEEDPVFANPAAGDFHISGATQVARRTGDPRWLP